jgi:hypothetical protein
LKAVVEKILETQKMQEDCFFTNSKDLAALAKQFNLDEINF